MKNYSVSRNVGVRAEYSEQAVWRKALGNEASLLLFAAREPHMDAPEMMPAGSTQSSAHGPDLTPAWRLT